MRYILYTVFTLAATGVAAPVVAQSMPGGAVGMSAGFGGAIALAGDDVLVGEPANTTRPGTVYVYRRGGNGWAEAAQIRSGDAGPADGFGSAVAADGETLVIGASAHDGGRGAAFVFRRVDGTWTQAARLAAEGLEEGVRFGSAVAIRGDVAVVSAPGADGQAGAVFVFRRAGDAWAQAARLSPAAAAPRALFGTALAIGDDGIFVGMPGANENRGAIVAFRPDAQGGWAEASVITTPQLQPNDRLGTSLALDDGVLLAGSPFTGGQSGAVYTFRRGDDGAWHQAGRLVGFDAGPNYRFGTALAFDGSELWVGAPLANRGRGGAYHIWLGDDGQWAGVGKLMPAVELAQSAQFGATIAARQDLAAVGLTGDDHGAGTVVIFERTDSDWIQRSVLKSPPGSPLRHGRYGRRLRLPRCRAAVVPVDPAISAAAAASGSTTSGAGPILRRARSTRSSAGSTARRSSMSPTR
jgi:hypothetical protein